MAHLILSQVPVESVDFVEGTNIQKLVYEGYRKEVPPNIQKRPSPVKSGNVHNLHAMSTVTKPMPQAWLVRSQWPPLMQGLGLLVDCLCLLQSMHTTYYHGHVPRCLLLYGTALRGQPAYRALSWPLCSLSAPALSYLSSTPSAGLRLGNCTAVPPSLDPEGKHVSGTLQCLCCYQCQGFPPCGYCYYLL